MSINKTHGKNKDKYLDRNGIYEISAEDVQVHIDTFNAQLTLKADQVDLLALADVVDTKQDILSVDVSQFVAIVNYDGTDIRSDVLIDDVRDRVNGLARKLTTLERDALIPVNGMLIYNTTLDKFQAYENNAWVNMI